MKLFFIIIPCCYLFIIYPNCAVASSGDIDTIFFSKFDHFLNSYVSNGSVLYTEINEERMNELLNIVENYSFAHPDNESEKKAFWINAYNLFAIATVIKYYPINSPMDVNGFFDQIKHKAAGENLTLDEIEKIKLVQLTGDPRIHFAIVCAAAGCPEIITEAYLPGSVDKQLEKRTRKIINDERYVNYKSDEKLLLLNEIFKWYKDEFEKPGLNLIDFLNRYRLEPVPADTKIIYTDYDWKLNETAYNSDKFNFQVYTPSALLNPGQFEIKIFNNLYTQTAFFNSTGKTTELEERNTFLTTSFSFLYGITDKINAGIELWFRSVRNDDKNSSPFSLFDFQNPASGRSAISHGGLKIKFAPFNNEIFNPLSIQSVFLLPLTSDLSGNPNHLPYLDEDAYIWINQFFYDLKFSTDFSYFGEIDTWLRTDRNFEGTFNSFQLPFKSFLNYYPNEIITLYVMAEFLHEWNGDTTSAYIQSGIGIKFIPIHHFEVEGLFTDFIYGKNKGAGKTFNIGIRLVY